VSKSHMDSMHAHTLLQKCLHVSPARILGRLNPIHMGTEVSVGSGPLLGLARGNLGVYFPKPFTLDHSESEVVSEAGRSSGSTRSDQ
jgi:hypothetical protein